MDALRGGVRRFNARLGWLLLRPERTSRAVIACIAIFSILGIPILTGLKFGQDLYMDSSEAYAWGQSFLGGYGRHPPMTGWIAGLWYRVFPASNWASYALSRMMVCISLVSIYFIARRVLDSRRAAFVVFVMMLYPLFATKSDVFNNYQVLLALVPLLVLVFLVTYENPTAKWGTLLGLTAAAATLTIYSGFLALFGIGLAAIIHPARGRFFASPAPYVAVLIYTLAVVPHIIWLIQWDMPSLRWAQSQMLEGPQVGPALRFLGQHAGLLSIPLAGAAIALWPWSLRQSNHTVTPKTGGFLVLVVTAVLIGAPPIFGIVLDLGLKVDWGNPLFCLVPIALLLLMPTLTVTRRAVVFAADVACAWTIILLVAAPVYPWVNFTLRPEYDAFLPFSELARELTRIWHEEFNSPLPIVVSGFDLAAHVVFYSPDHPRMFADFNPALSPWINYPSELHEKGFIGVCGGDADNSACLAFIDKLSPSTRHVDLMLSRKFLGLSGPMMLVHVRIARPGW